MYFLRIYTQSLFDDAGGLEESICVFSNLGKSFSVFFPQSSFLSKGCTCFKSSIFINLAGKQKKNHERKLNIVRHLLDLPYKRIKEKTNLIFLRRNIYAVIILNGGEANTKYKPTRLPFIGLRIRQKFVRNWTLTLASLFLLHSESSFKGGK